MSRFKEWYSKNADRMNEKRRQRYQTDPLYREKVLEQNKKSREEGKEDPNKLGSPDLAKLLGFTPRYVKDLEKDNVIPPTPYKDGNHSFYTQEMADAVKQVFNDLGSFIRKPGVKKLINSRISELWKSIGVANG